MTLLPGYFDYPHRRPGLDHDWFPHRNLPAAPKAAWPGGARVALWITVHLQHFPMDMNNHPFRPPGGMERPYPSYWDYTRRDYGNRVGIFRIMRALDRAGLRATAVMNAALATRYPALAREIAQRNWDIAASGIDMGHLHHGGLTLEAERPLVQQSVATLRQTFGAALTGWHSPAHSESMNTMALAAEAGLEWAGDWVNDDMPYEVKTTAGSITAMPLAWELSDQRTLFQQHQSTEDFVDAILRAHAVLDAEAAPDNGRILAISLTPWVVGQPHRIAALSQLLETLVAKPGIWPATAPEILAAWRTSILTVA